MGLESWSRDFWVWPLASIEMWRRALEPGPAKRTPPPWTTPTRLALELAALRLWDFSTRKKQKPVVVLAPYALHDAQIADIAPGHSPIAALLRHGCRRLFLAEWKAATPETRNYSIDDLLASLNVAVDDVGAPVDLVGLCQGGWLALLFAARFPKKIGSIVLVGAPVDVKADVSALSEPVAATSEAGVAQLIEMGGGCVSGALMAPLWPRERTDDERLAESLEIEPPFDTPQAGPVIEAFVAWDKRALDLPGPYFQQVFQHLYRDNLLAAGGFPALGQRVDMRKLSHPLYLLIGEKDGIAPPAQALAAARLAAGRVETARAPCGHLALFMGRRTIAREWPRIARWLTEGAAQP